MNIIAAVDQNWAIGKNNALLVSIPADLKFFREMTTGKVVVMGRKTLESFPGGLPLKNRTNIVLTKNHGYRVKGAVCVHSQAELDQLLEQYDKEEIYVMRINCNDLESAAVESNLLFISALEKGIPQYSMISEALLMLHSFRMMSGQVK